MARFIGLSVQKGAVASPFIVRSSEYTRSTGIGTTASPGSGNNVTNINDDNGNWTIDNILYDSVRTGIITQYTETISGVSKTFQIAYDSNQDVTSITELE